MTTPTAAPSVSLPPAKAPFNSVSLPLPLVPPTGTINITLTPTPAPPISFLENSANLVPMAAFVSVIATIIFGWVKMRIELKASADEATKERNQSREQANLDREHDEHIKGKISQKIWLSQESWKEKFKLYMELLDAVDAVFHAANLVAYDVRVFRVLPPDKDSGISEGVMAFPDHREAIERQTESMSTIVQLSLKALLLLPKDSNDALEPVRRAYHRATHVKNLSYHRRESELAKAAGESQHLLISAAKKDLGV